MPVAKLKDAEVPADGVERFARSYLRRGVRTRWNDARLRPALEMRVEPSYCHDSPSTRCLPPVPCHLLPPAPCPLPAACRPLPAASCQLPAASCRQATIELMSRSVPAPAATASAAR